MRAIFLGLGAATQAERAILLCGALSVVLIAGVAWTSPGTLLPILMLGPAALMLVLLARHPVPCSLAWLLVAGTTPEMWLDKILPGTSSADTAAVKLVGVVLAVICAVRYGVRRDLFNPSYAFIWMFFAGLAHGILPPISFDESLRSLIGSVAPFAFSFSRLSRRWCRAIILGTIWVPPVVVAFGALLAAAHLYPLFDEDRGTRLAGSTHPAFLAALSMFGVYAALVELFRTGRFTYQVAMALNFLILLASGGRGALFGAAFVSMIAFICLPSDAFPRARRLPVMLLGGLLLAVGLFVAVGGSDVRILALLSSNVEDLSNRDVIWPYFLDAWQRSPWVGWGIGAGRGVIDPDSLVAHLLGTTAAHDEYLRMGVEGGYVGLTLLIGSFIGWTTLSTRPMWFSEKAILRLVMLAFAVNSITDNTLIAAPASILFAWLSAVFARARLEDLPTFRPLARVVEAPVVG